MNKFISSLALLSFFSIWTQVYAHGPDEGYPMGPWMWWGHGMGWWIFPFLMIVVMLIICFLLFRRKGGMSSWCDFGEQKDAETPLDILKKRYAKGEITKEEFEKIKKDL
ncbi:MAG: SHOCT domain-containing protein [Nitrospiraceae bacterium]|nr:MAG: SHOCT domain-containing protein [Nitrospiraceae bacterium]